MNNGITITALIVIASFTIDRIAAATFFLLSFLRPWNDLFPDSSKNLKLVYYVFVGALALFAVTTWDIYVLQALNIQNASLLAEVVFSAMVLMGGSGQIAALLNAPHATTPVKSSAEPIEIRGRITLEDEMAGREKRGAS